MTLYGIDVEGLQAILLSPKQLENAPFRSKKRASNQHRVSGSSGDNVGVSRNRLFSSETTVPRSYTVAGTRATSRLADTTVETPVIGNGAPVRDTPRVASTHDIKRMQRVEPNDTPATASSYQAHTNHAKPRHGIDYNPVGELLLRNTGSVQRRDPVYPFRFSEGPHRSPSNSPRRYHIAFRSPTPSRIGATVSQPSRQNYTRETSSETALRSQAQTASPVFSENNVTTSLRDMWKSVDDSIGQMYEDPPIEFVANRLFHVKMGSTGPSRKRIRQNQHERVIIAAEELHEAQIQRRANQEQFWRRKEKIQDLSEAIRRRNKRYTKSMSKSTDVNAGMKQRQRLGDRVPGDVIERKPPVPRLSGSRHQPLKRKRSTSRQNTDMGGESAEDAPSPPLDANRSGSATVSVSVVVPSARLPDEEVDDPLSQNCAVDRDVIVDTCRDKSAENAVKPKKKVPGSKRKSRESKAFSDKENTHVERTSQALYKRREIAREYMIMQQQQRAIHKQKAKQKEQMEREKRRQQLQVPHQYCTH